MPYKNRYLKYKNKYLELKNNLNQIGGAKEIINRDDASQQIVIDDKKTFIDLELEINKIPKEKLENRRELGDFFFYSEPEIKDLNANDFKIVEIIFKKIRGTVTSEDLNFLDGILGIKHVVETEFEALNNSQIMHYTYINPIPNFFKVPNINVLFSLFISFYDHSFTIPNQLAYLLNTEELISERLLFLKSYGISKPINIFNKEKKTIANFYVELNKIYHLFETIYINDLKIDYSKSDGHKNTGILILDKPYFYKELYSFRLETMFIGEILRNYKFILDCNNMNIDADYGNYKLHFVTIPLKIIVSLKGDNFIIGYLMEVVEGYTLRQIRKKYAEYWAKNYEIIKRALHSLVEILTKKHFLIVDFNDDNVMWNMESNTLIYIDISQVSFIRKDEVHNNVSVHEDIESLY
jgi:hypothetical protein